VKEIKALYLKYVQAGYPPKEAAKKVQLETGLSAVTGQPLSREPSSTKEEYKGQYGN
jgi:hypothetical protein